MQSNPLRRSTSTTTTPLQEGDAEDKRLGRRLHRRIFAVRATRHRLPISDAPEHEQHQTMDEELRLR